MTDIAAAPTGRHCKPPKVRRVAGRLDPNDSDHSILGATHEEVDQQLHR